MAYAQTSDVEVRLGRPPGSPATEAQWGAWLDDVEDIITRRLGDLAALIAAGKLSELTLVRVEANAVIRKINNPDGKQNERVDDYAYGRSEAAASGELGLTDEEWDDLTPDSATDAFSIRLVATPGYADEVCDL